MLDISYASDIRSAIMAELAGVDGIWTVAREVFEAVSRRDDILVTVIIGHEVRDGKYGPLVTVFVATGRDPRFSDAKSRFDCTGPQDRSGGIATVTVKTSHPEGVTEHPGWREALGHVAGSIATHAGGE